MLDTGLTETRREAAKSERRERIVDAAWALLREVGMDALSMTMIAERASVSPATVYNLFQTKAAVLQQVFDRDLSAFEKRVAKSRAANPIDRVFRAIEIAASLYRADPGFYRAMMYGGRRGDTLYSAVSAPRIGFWQGMVAQAVAGGFLRKNTNANIVGVTLSQIARGALCEWTAESISAERLDQETQYGFALVLSYYATAKGAEFLGQRIRGLETTLSNRKRGATAASNQPAY